MEVAAPPAMLQNHVEFQQLLDLYCQRRPARVLEVGVGQGGTLYHWLQNAPAGSLVVALDDHHRNRASYLEWNVYATTRLVTITGSSQDPDVILDVARYRPFDFVFIDADHHDQAVRADWRHYQPMTTRTGVVALHDISPCDDPSIEVDGLWAELKAGYDVEEFTVPGGPGIGVVFLDEGAA